ncbi:PIG-L deacetylase family protein [Candidatus Cyanaurora vandensis]|uniref:PIG-L deacetylase family protein n=1 Tax=Candidatus Cyanaurora vandensis TaxID=2714958 RepID=UPI00257C8A06|nr:PIG-L deacetylase family protein [Candidatus Cyanaurora vandensis]
MIPDLLESRRVLCIQPHPDDADIGAGGTLARLVERGAEVIYLTVTDGTAGSDDPDQDPNQLKLLRRGEQQKALDVLGVPAELVWLDYQDGYLSPSLTLRDTLINYIRQYQPDLVLTVDPWLPYEAHNDHPVTGLMAAQAVMFASTPRIAPSSLPPHRVCAIGFFFSARPNTTVDVSTVWEQKLQAIQCHHSQFGSQWAEYKDFFDTQARSWGGPQGYARAEVFKVLTPLHLHCFPNAESS